MKRTLCLVLAILMCISFLPSAALAGDEAPNEAEASEPAPEVELPVVDVAPAEEEPAGEPEPTETPAPPAGGDPGDIPGGNPGGDPGEEPEPTATPEPTETPVPTETPEPTPVGGDPASTEPPAPTETPEPTPAGAAQYDGSAPLTAMPDDAYVLIGVQQGDVFYALNYDSASGSIQALATTPAGAPDSAKWICYWTDNYGYRLTNYSDANVVIKYDSNTVNAADSKAYKTVPDGTECGILTTGGSNLWYFLYNEAAAGFIVRYDAGGGGGYPWFMQFSADKGFYLTSYYYTGEGDNLVNGYGWTTDAAAITVYQLTGDPGEEPEPTATPVPTPGGGNPGDNPGGNPGGDPASTEPPAPTETPEPTPAGDDPGDTPGGNPGGFPGSSDDPGSSVEPTDPDVTSGTCGEGLTWSLEDGVLTISGTGDMDGYRTSYAPWYYYHGDITEVVLEDGVASIGEYAFMKFTALTSVTIPSSVTSIAEGAFSGCSSLTSVALPDGIDAVAPYLFYYCEALQNVDIPSGVMDIGNYAFRNCTALTSIEIPDSVTSIGNYAFYYCRSLSSIIIPENVASIGNYTFASCSGLTDVEIHDGVTSIGNYAFRYCSSLTSIVLPESVTSIGSYAFSDCTGLANVEIPDSVTSIGDYVFYNCRGLTSIVIPEGVTVIGNYAFNNCSSLTSVVLPESLTSIGSSAFRYCSSLTSVVLPESLTSIGNNAFYNCTSLTNVAIPDSVTSIGNYVFYNCSSLTSIDVDADNAYYSSEDGVLFSKGQTELIAFPGGKSGSYAIPSGVTSIAEGAFTGCRSLTSVVIPDGVTSIASSMFGGCSSLTSVDIPDSVTSIGANAFDNCTSLTSIEIPDSVMGIGNYAFRYCSSLKSIEIPDGVTSIGYSVFESCTSLTNVAIPDSVTSIGNYAFRYCSNLKNIEIPGSVTSIGNYAFYSCTSLKSVVLPESVTSIGNTAFGSTALQDIFYEGTEEQWSGISINDSSSAFTGAAVHYAGDSGVCGGGLNWMMTQDGVLVIYGDGEMDDYVSGSAPWSGYQDSVTKLVIYGGVTAIGAHAFEGFGVLSEIRFEGAAPAIDGTAFGGVTATADYPRNENSWTAEMLQDYGGSITWSGSGGASDDPSGEPEQTSGSCGEKLFWSLDDGILTISGTGDMVDYSYSTAPWYSSRYNIYEVVIEDGVTHIGKYAFYYCNYLRTVTFYSSVASIGEAAFSGCWNIQNIYYYGTKAEWNDMYVDTMNWMLTEDNAYIHYMNEPPVSDGGTLETGLTWTLENGRLTISGSGPMPDFDGWSRVAPWGQYSSWNGSEITELVIEDGVSYIGSYAFSYTAAENVTIPSSVTAIGELAFYYCRSLTSVTILSGVTEIGESAFYYCRNLVSVELPDSLTDIGSYAFGICGLTEIVIPDSVTNLGDAAFVECYSLESAVLGSGVTEIPDRLFQNCSGLTSVSIPDSVAVIGASAFAGTALRQVSIPGSVREIRRGAFERSELLAGGVEYDGSEEAWRQIQIYGGNDTLWAAIGYELGTSGLCGPDVTWTVNGDTLTLSGTGSTYDYKQSWHYGDGPEYAENTMSAPWAAYNSSITNIVVESGVTRIGDSLFFYSEAESITLPETLTAIGSGAFQSCLNLTELDLPEGLVSIGERAFRSCPNLTELDLPDGLVSLGDMAFYDCSALTSIVLPDSLTEIGQYVFSWCQNLASVTLPQSVTSVAYGMFQGCYSLPTVDIPASVTAIEPYAFSNCEELSTIELPEGLTTIGRYAFVNCNSLTDITIPDGVTSIDYCTFSSCGGLTSVTLPDGLQSIGESAFLDCYSLTSIDIPAGVTSIGRGAFEYCSSLTSVTIPEGVTCIEEYTFFWCNSLESVDLGSGVTTLEYGAFMDCSSLASVTIPASVQSIENRVFSGGSSIETITFEGAAPAFGSESDGRPFSSDGVFCDVIATAYYPAGGENWTADVRQDYGGAITWSAVGLAIVAQPKDTAAVSSGTAVLTVGAEGSGQIKYQWQYSKDGGSTWKNCTSAGCKTDTFSFTMKDTLDGRLYRCIVSNEDGSITFTSDAAAISLFGITSQPQGVTAAKGETVTLTVAAEAIGTISYQWQFSKDGGATWKNCSSPGFNTDTFSFAMTAGLDGRLYRCKVRDDRNNETFSDAAEITLFAITAQPGNVAARAGDPVTLTVAASGDELAYQWQYSKDGGSAWKNCTGEGYDTDTFSFTMKDALDGRLYRCKVTRGDTTLISDAAAITLFGITGQPQDVTAAKGETVTLTVAAVGSDLTYQWQYSKNGGESWTSCKTGDFNKDTFSFAMTAGLNGRQYRCKVSDGKNNEAFSDAAALTLFAITAQPQDVTALAGRHVTMKVAASCDELEYQWQYKKVGGSWKNCTSEGCNTDTFSFDMADKLDGRQYRCKVTRGDTTLTSDAATVTLALPPVITENPSDVTTTAGETVTLTVAAESSRELSYQWQYKKVGGVWKNFAGEGWDTDTISFTMTAEENGRQYRCYVTDGVGGIALSEAAAITLFAVTAQPQDVTAVTGDQVTLTVAASGDGLAYRWQYSKDGGSAWKNCSGEGYDTDTFSFTMKDALDGRQYRCKVTRNGTTLISDAAVITLFGITGQPQDVTAAKGETVTLTVAAESGGQLGYQWWYSKDCGENWIQCQTGGFDKDTFEFSMKATLDGRQYRCVVTDSRGYEAVSEAATITLG